MCGTSKLTSPSLTSWPSLWSERLWRCALLPGCNEFDGLIVAPSGQRSTSQRAWAERSSHLHTGRTHSPMLDHRIGHALE